MSWPVKCALVMVPLGPFSWCCASSLFMSFSDRAHPWWNRATRPQQWWTGLQKCLARQLCKTSNFVLALQKTLQ